MKSKLIIILLSVLLIASITTNIILLTKQNTNNSDTASDDTNSVVGIYHTNNYDNKGIESNLILKEDNTCTYFNNDDSSCTYTASNNGADIVVFNYNVADNRGVNYSYNFYPTLDACNVVLERLTSGDTNKGVDLSCVKHTYKHTLTSTNNGYLLDNDLLLTKIK